MFTLSTRRGQTSATTHAGNFFAIGQSTRMEKPAVGKTLRSWRM